jgi:Pyruvate/2-oxoacid:ferredoxin oxidoreductase delta subunit
MGQLLVDPATGQTNHGRIFAGGDATPGPRSVTWAMAAGRRAAWGIDRALRGAAEADRRPPPPGPRPVHTEVPLGHPPKVPRNRPRGLSVEERLGGFAEVVGCFSETQALAEAARCLACGSCGQCRSCIELLGCPAFFVAEGRVQIDASLCMGCGICAVVCPNRAIYPVGRDEVSDGSSPRPGPQQPPVRRVSP